MGNEVVKRLHLQKPNESFESVVERAKKKEEAINKKHPERHGYGMTMKEAEPFIKALYVCGCREEKAQAEKVRTRVNRLIEKKSKNLSSLDPLEIIIKKEEISIILKEIRAVRIDIPEALTDLYDAYFLDRFTQLEIAKSSGTSQSTVSRNLSIVNKQIQERIGSQ